MKYKRENAVRLITSWVGAIRGDSTHKHILDLYNRKMGTRWGVNTPWCAITWSAVFIELGYEAIAPLDASCGNLIIKANRLGIWQERDDYVPSPGDGIIYDWDDGKDYATTDDTEGHQHVGMVIEVDKINKKFMVAEGNMSDASVIGTRVMKVNGRYIRGFICPKYDIEITEYVVQKGDTSASIIRKLKEQDVDITWKQICELNGLRWPWVNRLTEGQILQLK